MSAQNSYHDTPGSTIPRISIDGQSDYGDESTEGSDTDATWDDTPISSETDEALGLEDRIWRRSVKHANGGTSSFWPPGVLKRIITRQAVTNEILRAFPNYSRKEGEGIAERVWEDKSGKCVKIFIILVLLDEVKVLVEHILECRQGEVNALKRFSGKVHPHLITLLATFTQEGYYYLIFPWAECDLDRYWEDNPKPDPGDVGLVQWLSKQCLKIMEAVDVIHNPSHLTSEKRYGRHGDIKAENILWYKSRPDDPDDRGILVISDLGLTAINSDKSRSMQPNTGLKMTPSYRPPECDMKDGKISRSFDIWTLGCLYLELVCWLLRGNEGKVNFDQARTTPFIFGTRTNIYFDIEERKQTAPGKFVFKVKDVVSKTISELHDEPYCSKWVHDLLDLVENDMLVVLSTTHTRKTAKTLLDKLRDMDEKVQSSSQYSTGRAPQNRTPYWRPQVGTTAELNEAAHQNVVDHGVGTHQSDERQLEQSEDLARLDY
ncbi:hypothetical protein SLS63_003770 [Diaporthe eres]|uniref:Protein kinase domain-containing protein n=1 Tax=Diaporthe eres TaxID=83184 RepID=A0ABR1PG63_DIAER